MTLLKYRRAGLEFNSGAGPLEFGDAGGFIERLDNTGFKTPERETKSRPLAGGEFKQLTGPKHLQGVAIHYNQVDAFKSAEASFDVMMPGCCARTLAGNHAVRFQLDHKNGSPFLIGTSADRLALHDTEEALYFRIELSDTEAGYEAKTGVENGTRDGMSPAYIPKAWRIETIAGLGPVRFLSDIDLLECSLVSNGAMPNAFASLIDASEHKSLAAECTAGIVMRKRERYVAPIDRYKELATAYGLTVYGDGPRHLQKF